MIRGRKVKVILLILIGVVFFGCSNIRRNSYSYILDKTKSYEKNTLTPIVHVSFSKNGKYLYFNSLPSLLRGSVYEFLIFI